MKYLLAGLILSTPILIHGDADWIQENPEYKTITGSHCCGPTDCFEIPDGEIQEVSPGIWYSRRYNQVLEQGDPDVYASRKAKPFWCLRGGKIVCFFYAGGST